MLRRHCHHNHNHNSHSNSSNNHSLHRSSFLKCEPSERANPIKIWAKVAPTPTTTVEHGPTPAVSVSQCISLNISESNARYGKLNDEIDRLSQRMAPPIEEVERKKIVLDFLQSLVRQQWPEVCCSQLVVYLVDDCRQLLKPMGPPRVRLRCQTLMWMCVCLLMRLVLS